MTPEEKELFARIDDLKNTSAKRNAPCFTGFLTPVEQAFIKNNREINKSTDITFEGGYESPERAMAVVSPKGYAINGEIYPPISVLSVNYKGDKLSHRDILGALMGLGIKRGKIGDILDSIQPQLIICDNKISDYIIQNFTKAGKSNIVCKPAIIEKIPEQSFDSITSTVASLRLDSIIAEGFSLPRSKAAEAVKRGIVYVNWTLADSPSKEIKPGDSITLRGMGKIRLKEISGLSRKGRTFIIIDKFVK